MRPERAFEKRPALAIGDQCLVKLNRGLDPNMLILEAEVLALSRDGVSKVRITSGHPVWRGCELSKGYFRLARKPE